MTSKKRIIIPVVQYINVESEQDFLNSLKSNGEWDEALLVPLSYLSKNENWSVGSAGIYNILFCPISADNYMSTDTHNEKRHLLWGATARMVFNFFKLQKEAGINLPL